MRENIMRLISEALMNRANRFFIREQDIQLYLAKFFLDSNLFDNVFIEYHVPREIINNYPWVDTYQIYIDIVLENHGHFYPIEIKYKTVTQILPILLFGEERYVSLRQQGAQNIGCYDFWKDIKRIELFQERFSRVERGVALFISNDPMYRQAPLNNNAGYSQFSIHHDRYVPAGSILSWNRNLKIANNRPSMRFNYEYHINWVQMQIPDHYYILI